MLSISSEKLVMEWKNIETAPKDGTIVLLFWQGWNGIDDPDCNPEIARYVDGYWFALGVYPGEGECCSLGKMSHWMPFPTPPIRGRK